MITLLYAKYVIPRIPDTVEPETIWYIGAGALLADALLVSVLVVSVRIIFD